MDKERGLEGKVVRGDKEYFEVIILNSFQCLVKVGFFKLCELFICYLNVFIKDIKGMM